MWTLGRNQPKRMWSLSLSEQEPVRLRDDAIINSQIRGDGVVPSRQCVAVFKAERGDETAVGFETGGVVFSIQIGSHYQAGLGAGGANEFEHFFVAVEGLGSPVLGDLGK